MSDRGQMRHLRARVYEMIDAERQRQDDKWGYEPPRSIMPMPNDERVVLGDKLAILIEEAGEVAKAHVEHDFEEMVKEIVQTAAVCVVWLESILFDRGARPPEPERGVDFWQAATPANFASGAETAKAGADPEELDQDPDNVFARPPRLLCPSVGCQGDLLANGLNLAGTKVFAQCGTCGTTNWIEISARASNELRRELRQRTEGEG